MLQAALEFGINNYNELALNKHLYKQIHVIHHQWIRMYSISGYLSSKAELEIRKPLFLCCVKDTTEIPHPAL